MPLTGSRAGAVRFAALDACRPLDCLPFRRRPGGRAGSLAPPRSGPDRLSCSVRLKRHRGGLSHRHGADSHGSEI